MRRDEKNGVEGVQICILSLLVTIRRDKDDYKVAAGQVNGSAKTLFLRAETNLARFARRGRIALRRNSPLDE